MPKSNGHYSQCIEHANTLFITGQLPINPATKLIPDDIENQTLQALSNLELILRVAGSCKDKVIQVRIYLVGIDHWDSVNKVYSAYFGDHRPVRCIVPVPELHFGSLIEIEATSATNKG